MTTDENLIYIHLCRKKWAATKFQILYGINIKKLQKSFQIDVTYGQHSVDKNMTNDAWPTCSNSCVK